MRSLLVSVACVRQVAQGPKMKIALALLQGSGQGSVLLVWLQYGTCGTGWGIGGLASTGSHPTGAPAVHH